MEATKHHQKRPKVGVGVIITNQLNEVLITKRLTLGKDLYGLPGGHLEMYEKFEQCAQRELEEETALTIPIDQFKFVGIVNAYDESAHYHYIDIYMMAQLPDNQTPKNTEPDKQEDWQWITWSNLQDLPLFYPLNLFYSKMPSIESIIKESQKEKVLYY